MLLALNPGWRRVQARNETAEQNQGLVYKMAHKKVRAYGGRIDDLAQEGNIGMLHGIELYNPEKSARSTYFTLWIRQAMGRFTLEDRTIRIPIHAIETANRLRKLERKLTFELKRPPTTEEIAERAGMEVENVRNFFTQPKAEQSLDEPLKDDEGEERKRDVPDEGSPDAEKETILLHLRGEIRRVLGHLTEMEKKVTMHRFGLLGAKEMTLREIGDEFGLSRERIRQIEQKALLKLRTLNWAEELRSYS
jgi:RNA polymerase primary sigma factor